MSTPAEPGQPRTQAAPPVCYRHPDRETYIRCQRCDRPICPDCMRDAAVGFQCPECVKAGAKSTRQGKATYGGARMLKAGATSMALIGINVVIWIAITATPLRGGPHTLVNELSLRPQAIGPFPGVSGGAYWQLITSVFAHQAGWHLIANMVSLYFIGPTLEQVFGRARFLAIYLGSGLAGSAAVMWLSNPLGSTLGASGAIFGLLGSLLVLTLKQRLDPRQVLMWLGLNLAITFLGSAFISWQGHLGGLAGGIVLTAVIVYAPRRNRETWQWTGIATVVVLAVVAALVRASLLG